VNPLEAPQALPKAITDLRGSMDGVPRANKRSLAFTSCSVAAASYRCPASEEPRIKRSEKPS